MTAPKTDKGWTHFVGAGVSVAASVNTNKYENDDVSRTDNIKSSESDGGFTVVPTVGAMWSF